MAKKLEVEREKAVVLFQTMGFKMADGWDDGKLLDRIGKITEILPDDFDPEPEMAELCLAIQDAAAEGGPGVALVDGPEEDDPEPEPEEDDGEEAEADGLDPEPEVDDPVTADPESGAKKPKKEKPKKEKPKKEKPKKEKPKKEKPKKDKSKPREPKPKDKLDGFGLRQGTLASKFAACIDNKPKSMRELLTMAGLEKTMYNVAKKLIADGHIVRTDDKKYRLA